MSAENITLGTAFTPQIEEKDWAKIRSEFDKEAKAALEDLKNELEQVWAEKARSKMKTSADKYLQGVSFTVRDDGVEVTIEGWLPVALEQGAQGFDMKTGLLAGRQSRAIRLENGNIRTVSVNSPPTSWYHPGITGRGIIEDVEKEADEIIERTVTTKLKSFLDRVEV